jgi:hypothetical protein
MSPNNKRNFLSEADVSTFYKAGFEKVLDASFYTAKGSNWQTDGIIEWTAATSVKLLLELKYQADLTKDEGRSNVLAQALYYIKRFKEKGDIVPNVIFIGDKNDCFAISTKALEQFLDSPIDWNLRPSSPDQALSQLIKTSGISPDIIYNTNGLNFKLLVNHCEVLAKGTLEKVKATPLNMTAMFQYWVDRIIPASKKYSPVQMIDIFFGCLFYPEHDSNFAYVHPKQKDTIVLGKNEYSVNVEAMNGFFQRYQRGYSTKEIDILTGMRDRIIDDVSRRRQGAFYTPSLWVDQAHNDLSKVLGTNWRNECLVWDCSSGTGNLTRDYNFNDLILSTLEEPDVQAIKREGYNQGCSLFQYDFLNPEAESTFEELKGENRLPLNVIKQLQKAAEEGKRLVFLINPPYATASAKGTGILKTGVAQTKVNEAMKKANLGSASQQLYAQFIYQCNQIAEQYGFDKKTIALFSNAGYLTSGSYKPFREWMYSNLSFQDGFIFQASHFADVSDAWGISFAIWNEGKTLNHDIHFNVKDIDMSEIVDKGKKLFYVAKDNAANVWVRERVKGIKTSSNVPQFTSSFKIRTDDDCRGSATANSLMYLNVTGNSPQQIKTGTVLYATTAAGGNGLSVIAGETWRRAIALFSARKLTTQNWLNDKDEYLKPIASADLEQWIDDCHVYALFHSANQITALRNLDVKGVKVKTHNHLFWLTRAEAQNIYSSKTDTREMSRDCKNNYHSIPAGFDESNESWVKNGDPYFAHILPTLNLSPLAKEIMDDLNALFIKSLPQRAKYNEVEHSLQAWDAGIAQLRKVWETDTDLNTDWTTLKAKCKKLADQLKPGVEKHGFLLK